MEREYIEPTETPLARHVSFLILYLYILIVSVFFPLLHYRNALVHDYSCLPRMQLPLKNAGLSLSAFIGSAVPSRIA